ncbi:MAG: hypothetical protein WA690_17265, partial [Candidatus Acidiferrales bacterium]
MSNRNSASLRTVDFHSSGETTLLQLTYHLYMRLARRLIVLGIVSLVISPLLAAFVGSSVGNG